MRALRREYRRPHGALNLTITDAEGVPIYGAYRSPVPTDVGIHRMTPGVMRTTASTGANGRTSHVLPHTGSRVAYAPRGPVYRRSIPRIEYAVHRQRVQVPPNGHLNRAVRAPLETSQHADGSVATCTLMNYAAPTVTLQRFCEVRHARGAGPGGEPDREQGRAHSDIAYFDAARPARPQVRLHLHDEEYHTYWGIPGCGPNASRRASGLRGTMRTRRRVSRSMNADVFAWHVRRGAGWIRDRRCNARSRRSDARAHARNPGRGRAGWHRLLRERGFNEDAMATQRVGTRYSTTASGSPGGGTTLDELRVAAGPLGVNRVYVQTNGPVTQRSFLAG